MIRSTVEIISVAGIPLTHFIAHPPSGIGKPVLALHGWGADHTLMKPVAERLALLGYSVYAPDLPSFGATPAPASPWTVFDYANFSLRYIDALGFERVHLIGHSFGGRIGLILGADHPERIGKIALADSAGVPPRRSLLQRVRLRAYKLIRGALERAGARGLAAALREKYNRRYGSADYQNTSGVMRTTFVNIVNENLLPFAARIQCPTLLFWGMDDADTPLWQGETLEKTIPDAGLIVFENAGHYSYLERLGDFVRIVDHFFKQADGS